LAPGGQSTKGKFLEGPMRTHTAGSTLARALLRWQHRVSPMLVACLRNSAPRLCSARHERSSALKAVSVLNQFRAVHCTVLRRWSAIPLVVSDYSFRITLLSQQGCGTVDEGIAGAPGVCHKSWQHRSCCPRQTCAHCYACLMRNA
jgi:hypothetical protein